MTDWSNERVIEFLELVEGERVIWDATHKNHKVRQKVTEAWIRISKEMGISVKELKFKKKSLMATFRPLLKRKIKSIKTGSVGDDVFQPVWFAYDVMERFLGPTYDYEVVEETVESETDDEVQTNSNCFLYTPTHKIEDDSATADESSSFAKIPKQDYYHDVNEKINTETYETYNRKPREKVKHRVEKRVIEEDECDMYAKLLAKKLKKYPERMRDRIMYQIDGLLLDNPYPDEEAACSTRSQSP